MIHAGSSPIGHPSTEVRLGAQRPGFVGACAQACARRGISWDLVTYEGLAAGTEDLLSPVDLVVLGPNMPPGERKRILRYGLPGVTPAVHVCPAHWAPWGRALLLDEENRQPEGFLTLALELCLRLGLRPVILTVGPSERLAQLRQQTWRDRLTGSKLDCDFDLLVGGELRLAVSQVARWRRCQVIMMERPSVPPWWRWWRQAGTAEGIMGPEADVSFLALPATGLWASSSLGLSSAAAAATAVPCAVGH
jgi:hypothetical protein